MSTFQAPSPWHHETAIELIKRDKFEVRIADAAGIQFAKVYGSGRDPTEAMARVMAMAPEYLAYIERIARFTSYKQDSWTDEHAEDAIATLNNLIELARATCAKTVARIEPSIPETDVNASLLVALKAMLYAQSARRHPLGMPDEGIAGQCAEAASLARAAIAEAEHAAS